MKVVHTSAPPGAALPQEREGLAEFADGLVSYGNLTTPEQLIEHCHDADALLVPGARFTREVLSKLEHQDKTGRPVLSRPQEAPIERPGDSLRARLAGDVIEGVLTLIKRAHDEGGECYRPLYELSDTELIDALKELGAMEHGTKGRLQIILSNAGEDTEEGNGDGDSTNQRARQDLHALEINVMDRMLRKGHIGHNKFVVYVDKSGKAQAVLTGSTNWTPTGLCAQEQQRHPDRVPGPGRRILHVLEGTQGRYPRCEGRPFKTPGRGIPLRQREKIG